MENQISGSNFTGRLKCAIQSLKGAIDKLIRGIFEAAASMFDNTNRNEL